MQFNIGISSDLLTNEGKPCFGTQPLNALYKNKQIFIEWMDSGIQVLSEKETSKYNAILLNSPKLTKESINPKNNKLKIFSRFGVGYDSVDLDVLKKNKVILTNTPNAVRRPVAVASLTMNLSLSSKLMIKDKLLREGRWNERTNHMGVGLTNKTLGLIGFGGIGKEFVKISKDLFKKVICYDPFVDKEIIERFGGQKIENLDDGLKICDYVSLHVPLNEKTKNLIDYSKLKNMKREVIVINTARGGIINENDLDKALRENIIFGAGLDVFENEPIDKTNPLHSNKKVLLSPHSATFTNECKSRMSLETTKNIIDFFENKIDKSMIVKL